MATIKRKNKRQRSNFQSLKCRALEHSFCTRIHIYTHQVVAYVNDSDPIIFTVEQSTYDTDFTATGLAVRSETVITASATGTPCYYIRDGEKVSKGANIYAIDSSGSMQAAMSDMQENGSALLTSADYTSLNNQIKMFKMDFRHPILVMYIISRQASTTSF